MPERHLGRVREHIDEHDRTLRVSATSTVRDDDARLQTTVLRYEVIDGDDHQVVEQPWVLHWHTQSGFRELVADAGSPATEDAAEFAFVLRRSR